MTTQVTERQQNPGQPSHCSSYAALLVALFFMVLAIGAGLRVVHELANATPDTATLQAAHELAADATRLANVATAPVVHAARAARNAVAGERRNIEQFKSAMREGREAAEQAAANDVGGGGQ